MGNSKSYSKVIQKKQLDHLVFAHKSFLLRPLKDVDMQYQHNKVKNLQLAIDRINGIVIKPKETFSFWYLVGNPSKSRGYLKGLVLNQGEIGYDFGGGLCQMGNLLYWMILHSPLTVVERWRHGFDVFPDINRKLPFGSGATLSYNYIDFQFRNDTDEDYQLHLFLDETHLNGNLLSTSKPDFQYEVYEAEHLIRQESWGGYIRHNLIKRKMFKENELIQDESVTENHAVMMYAPLLPENKA